MRYGFLGVVAGWIMGAPLVLAQPMAPAPPGALPVPQPAFVGGGAPYGEGAIPELARVLSRGPGSNPALPDEVKGTSSQDRANAETLLRAALALVQSLPPAPPAPAPAAPAPAAEEGLRPYVEGSGPAPSWMKLRADGRCCPTQPNEVKYYGGHFWLNAEYLLWWFKEVNVPPLVTSGPASSAGILGNPGTTVLLGGGQLDQVRHNGMRVSLGYTCPDEILGIEGSGFYLFDRRVRFDRGSFADGTPVLARPVIDAQTGQETVQLIAFPGALSGDVQVSSFSRFWGSDVNLIGAVYGGCQANFEILAGFRFLDLDEDLRLVKTSTLQGNGRSGLNGILVLPPSSNVVTDRFETRNQFYGGQLGEQMELRLGRVFLDVTGKVALGVSHQTVTVAGSTSVTQPGVGTTTVPGGLLALAGNSGRFQHDEFAVVPEVQLNLGYQFCKGMRGYVGYDFLYWNNVARPEDQVSRTVNGAQVPISLTFGPGPATPPLVLRQSSFWTHGLNFGLALRY